MAPFRFTELAAKTNFSFLEGASHPEEMATAAQEMGYAALGIIDRHGVYGIPRAHEATKNKIPILVGAEVAVGTSRALLLAKNRKGYGDLCELLTVLHQDREKKESMTWEKIAEKGPDLYLLLPVVTAPPSSILFLKSAFGARKFTPA